MTDERDYDIHDDVSIYHRSYPFSSAPVYRASRVRNLAAYLAGVGVGVLLLVAIFRVTT